MKLYFLRHGKAEDHSADNTDFSRKLTPEGIDEMKRMANGLANVVGRVDAIVSSPLPRALETAKIAGAAIHFHEDDIIVSKKVASGAFGAEELASLLRDRSDEDRVMFVGHEPDFSSMVRYLTGARIEMKKAGVAFVETYELESGGGVLRWLLTPRCLILAAGDSD
jgi:phosphohistidine phosphatase